LRKAPVDLVALLTQAVEMVRERIDEKGCTLDMRLPDDPLPIMGDAALLVQAFRTLLENAAKFSSPGGRITLDAQRRGTDAVVTVRDEGAGITADLLPLIFEPFERKAPPGRKGEGLGVALALARAWMRLHGGEMRAESGGKDKGSLFEARLPLTRA
jgi:signal transduction histidine kinase